MVARCLRETRRHFEHHGRRNEHLVGERFEFRIQHDVDVDGLDDCDALEHLHDEFEFDGFARNHGLAIDGNFDRNVESLE